MDTDGMAFTLAKNATKPNPFEIIPLQTTRKENNWKTEEALTRAAVTGDGTGQRVQSLMFMMMILHSFFLCYITTVNTATRFKPQRIINSERVSNNTV